MTDATKTALADWHAGEACSLRKAAKTTAMDNPEPVRSSLMRRAQFHDEAATLLRANAAVVPSDDVQQRLFALLNGAAGDGLIINEIDAADLFCDMFPDHVEQMGEALALPPAQPDEQDDKWRDVALRFDKHRMQALWHLKAMLQDPEKHADIVRQFLEDPTHPAAQPTPGVWPFVETPGAFTERLAVAYQQFGNLLAAVRCVLIEQPPQFSVQPAPQAQGVDLIERNALIRDVTNIAEAAFYMPQSWHDRVKRLDLSGDTPPSPVAQCAHRFMHFGDQKKRRCADCSTFEPVVQTQGDPK